MRRLQEHLWWTESAVCRSSIQYSESETAKLRLESGEGCGCSHLLAADIVDEGHELVLHEAVQEGERFGVALRGDDTGRYAEQVAVLVLVAQRNQAGQGCGYFDLFADFDEADRQTLGLVRRRRDNEGDVGDLLRGRVDGNIDREKGGVSRVAVRNVDGHH